MTTRRRRLGQFAFLMCAALWSATIVSRAAEPWMTLPPTPTLPKGTVGRYAMIGGARIWYAEWNDKAAGTPVLLLHGGYANSNYFGHLIPFLVQHGYHVIAMDSRGHGRSTRTDAPYTYHLMANDVIALLDILKINQVSLVGWSDGGCIGYDLALNHPARLARLFAFGADADVSGLRDDFDKSAVFAAYLKRVPAEYRELSPTPDGWDGFNAAVGKMWQTLRRSQRRSCAPSPCPRPSPTVNMMRESVRNTIGIWLRPSPARSSSYCRSSVTLQCCKTPAYSTPPYSNFFSRERRCPGTRSRRQYGDG